MQSFFEMPLNKTPADSVKSMGTYALGCFIEETNHIWRLAAGVYSSALKSAVADTEVLDANPMESTYRKLDKYSASSSLTNKIITELIICRVVDNFQCYVSQLLEMVFKNNKATLLAASGKSPESKKVDIDLKTLFEFSTIEELFNHLVEKKISALSYKSIEEFSDFFKDKLGFNLFEDDVSKSIVNKAIQGRNIIVHNRAILDRKFVQRVGLSENDIGTQLHLYPSDVFKMHLFMADVAKKADERAVKKFSLPVVEFNSGQVCP